MNSSVQFFFNDTATTEIYTLSLHDALPILITSSKALSVRQCPLLNGVNLAVLVSHLFPEEQPGKQWELREYRSQDRKSTRLNSSHANISYAVFCLKKKNIFFYT